MVQFCSSFELVELLNYPGWLVHIVADTYTTYTIHWFLGGLLSFVVFTCSFVIIIIAIIAATILLNRGYIILL